MAVKARTRFTLWLAKLQAAESDVASLSAVAAQAIRELRAALQTSSDLDDKIGELLGLRMGQYAESLDPASAQGGFDADDVLEELKELGRVARRFGAASNRLNLDKLFRWSGVDVDGEDEDEDEDDGSAELDAEFLESE